MSEVSTNVETISGFSHWERVVIQTLIQELAIGTLSGHNYEKTVYLLNN